MKYVNAVPDGQPIEVHVHGVKGPVYRIEAASNPDGTVTSVLTGPNGEEISVDTLEAS